MDLRGSTLQFVALAHELHSFVVKQGRLALETTKTLRMSLKLGHCSRLVQCGYIFKFFRVWQNLIKQLSKKTYPSEIKA